MTIRTSATTTGRTPLSPERTLCHQATHVVAEGVGDDLGGRDDDQHFRRDLLLELVRARAGGDAHWPGGGTRQAAGGAAGGELGGRQRP